MRLQHLLLSTSLRLAGNAPRTVWHPSTFSHRGLVSCVRTRRRPLGLVTE